MTLMHRARNGKPVPEILGAAQRENVDPEMLRRKVAEGKVVATAANAAAITGPDDSSRIVDLTV